MCKTCKYGRSPADLCSSCPHYKQRLHYENVSIPMQLKACAEIFIKSIVNPENQILYDKDISLFNDGAGVKRGEQN